MVNRQATVATSIVFSLILVIVFLIDVAKIGKKFQTSTKTKRLFYLFDRIVSIMGDKRKLSGERRDVMNGFERIGTDLNKSENRKAFLNTSDNQKNATDNTFIK